jgi:hypothetical protein
LAEDLPNFTELRVTSLKSPQRQSVARLCAPLEAMPDPDAVPTGDTRALQRIRSVWPQLLRDSVADHANVSVNEFALPCPKITWARFYHNHRVRLVLHSENDAEEIGSLIVLVSSSSHNPNLSNALRTGPWKALRHRKGHVSVGAAARSALSGAQSPLPSRVRHWQVEGPRPASTGVLTRRTHARTYLGADLYNRRDHSRDVYKGKRHGWGVVSAHGSLTVSVRNSQGCRPRKRLFSLAGTSATSNAQRTRMASWNPLGLILSQRRKPIGSSGVRIGGL